MTSMKFVTEPETRKRKRIHKNKKKNWKKTDVTDIEEHLQVEGYEEQTGGLISGRSDVELFVIDTRKVYRSAKKSKIADRPLRCHAILELDSKIKPAAIRNNFRKDGLHRRCKDVQLRVSQGILTAKEKEAQAQRELAGKLNEEKLQALDKPKYVLEDIWAENDDDANADPFYLQQTKKSRVTRKPYLNKKKTTHQAVEVPHPGASYNPSFEDHQELLKIAVEAEKVKDREALKIKRAVDDKMQKVTHEENLNMWLSDMTPVMGDQPVDDDEPVGDLDKLSVNPPVKVKKKTRPQRNRQRRYKEKLKLLEEAKRKKNWDIEFNRLRNIKKEVNEKLSEIEERKAKNAAKRVEWEMATKKLSKLKFVVPDVEVKLSSELTGNLRSLKPEGEILQDRFKSFQKRNILEVREKAKFKRKYALRKFTKNSHKQPL